MDLDCLNLYWLKSNYIAIYAKCLCTFGYRYEVTLAQELLVLLIRLVSERGFCGLTEVEALRRELVQRLAVGDATHSALLKALPPRLQDSKHVQECLDSVATYRNPSGMQQVWLFVTIYLYWFRISIPVLLFDFSWQFFI